MPFNDCPPAPSSKRTRRVFWTNSDPGFRSLAVQLFPSPTASRSNPSPPSTPPPSGRARAQQSLCMAPRARQWTPRRVGPPPPGRQLHYPSENGVIIGV